MSPILFLWLSFRRWCWRTFSLPLPALPAWDALVREVATAGLYVGRDGEMGAPLAWSLMEKREGCFYALTTRCAWSGQDVSGVPVITDAGADVSHFGVRCARCGVPIHFRYSGMTSMLDVPSCPPCRRAVRRTWHQP